MAVSSSFATSRRKSLGTIDEMNADYISQITDCTRALTRLEGERPCSQRPITLNDSTLHSAISGVQEAVTKFIENTSDEQSDNLMLHAGCDGYYCGKKNKDMVCTKLLFLDLFSLKCLLCIPAEEKTVAG
jgi:hypothetical protein